MVQKKPCFLILLNTPQHLPPCAMYIQNQRLIFVGFTISRPETTPLPSHALNRKDFMGQQAFMPQLSNKTQHALSQYHHLCCWGCHIWLLFPLHLWPSGSSYVVCILSLHHQVSQCSQWLPSNRDCACFRLSRSSRWDLTRRWLTSLPYWLSAGCRAWDTINPHP